MKSLLNRRAAATALALLVAPAVASGIAAQDGPAAAPQREQEDQLPRQRQGQQRPQPGMIFERIERIVAELELNDEQRAKARQILDDARERARQLAPGASEMTPEERREEFQTLTAGVVDEISTLLSPEQRSRFSEEIGRLRRDMQNRPNAGGAQPGRPGAQPPTTRPDGATTRPAAGPQGRPLQQRLELPGGQRVARPMNQLRATLAEMGLGREQNEQIDAAFAALRRDLQRMVEEAGEDREAIVPQVRERIQATRETIAGILTPQQQQELARRLQAFAPQPQQQARNRGRERPTTRPGADAMDGPMQGGTDAAGGEMEMTGGADGAMDGMAGARPNAAPAADGKPRSAFLARLTTPPALEIGQALPEDLNVVTLAKKPRPMRQFLAERGSDALVVVLGSASSPTFRDRAGDIPWLVQQVRGDAEVLIIYTREQHPSGQGDVARNEADDVHILQHADIEARIAAARHMRETYKPRVELVVDTMDDAAVRELVGGVDVPHCAAFVFAADGTLIGRQQWFDPTGIPGLVEEAQRHGQSRN